MIVTDEELQKEIKDIWHILRGNGGAGFMERVRLLELQIEQNQAHFVALDKSVADMKDSIAALSEHNLKQAAEWRGFKRAVGIGVAIITFLIAGGYAAIVATLRTMLG